MSQPFPINHDLHSHTNLSACCHDDALTAAYSCGYAGEHGYSRLCITDHFWDADIPGASEWYAPQNLAHVKKALTLPKFDGVNILFGCETEYCGGNKLGIAPAHYDEFHMIVIPVNHFHMEGFVCPADCDTAEKLSSLLIGRMEELLEIDLPWQKVGVAHLNGCIFMGGRGYDRAMELLPEARLRSVFRRLAQKGAGIELNASCFGPDWMDTKNAGLRLLRIALEEKCKFYCASDAHTRADLGLVSQRMRTVADAIGLTAGDLFIPR